MDTDRRGRAEQTVTRRSGEDRLPPKIRMEEAGKSSTSRRWNGSRSLGWIANLYRSISDFDRSRSPFETRLRGRIAPHLSKRMPSRVVEDADDDLVRESPWRR